VTKFDYDVDLSHFCHNEFNTSTNKPAEFESLMAKKVIFVCTSNVCRSPAAEGLANKWLSDNGKGGEYSIISRSISTAYEPEQSPPSQFSVQIMNTDFGVDISSHRSQLITEEEIIEADVIVGITRSHCSYLRREFPRGDKY
jgi:protein-tyrosine-phosphatase